MVRALGPIRRLRAACLRRWTAAAVAAALMISVLIPTSPFDAAQRVRAADPAPSVIAEYRARIPELMAEQGIPGLAVALVDADQALWIEGFGHVDGPESEPVTTDTIFSVQSMSKLFTATAVMQAVAAGRLELDTPITTYLPTSPSTAPSSSTQSARSRCAPS